VFVSTGRFVTAQKLSRKGDIKALRPPLREAQELQGAVADLRHAHKLNPRRNYGFPFRDAIELF
jgi:hypothetical protein